MRREQGGGAGRAGNFPGVSRGPATNTQDDLVFSTGQEVHDKLEMITNHDGTTGWYLAQKVPVHDARQNVIALAGISTDLKQSRRPDQQLGALAGTMPTIRATSPARCASPTWRRKPACPSATEDEDPRRTPRLAKAVAHANPHRSGRPRLRESREPLGRIAFDCGFYDQAMFCRQFRSATGLTPGNCRATRRRA